MTPEQVTEKLHEVEQGGGAIPEKVDAEWAYLTLYLLSGDDRLAQESADSICALMGWSK
jgi:hypothetical protein